MGGLVCAIRRNAALRFEQVPTKESQTKEFDKQIRELILAAGIAEAIAGETSHGQQVCDILAKHEWSPQDRKILFEVIESLYENAPGG